MKRTCLVCKKEYIAPCPNCGDVYVEPWHNILCSENCRNIADVFLEYKNGTLSAEQANKDLQKFDLSNIDGFKKTYDEILSKCGLSGKKAKAGKKSDLADAKDVFGGVEAIPSKPVEDKGIFEDAKTEPKTSGFSFKKNKKEDN